MLIVSAKERNNKRYQEEKTILLLTYLSSSPIREYFYLKIIGFYLCLHDMFNKVNELNMMIQNRNEKKKKHISFVFSHVWTCLICSSSTRFGTFLCHMNTLNEIDERERRKKN
jgi:hypothetical protein